MDAAPIGIPGCPDAALWTASMLSVRMVSMQRSSMAPADVVISRSCSAPHQRRRRAVVAVGRRVVALRLCADALGPALCRAPRPPLIERVDVPDDALREDAADGRT